MISFLICNDTVKNIISENWLHDVVFDESYSVV